MRVVRIKTRIRFESIFAAIVCDALRGEALSPSIVSKSNSLKIEADEPTMEVKSIIKRTIWGKNSFVAIERLKRKLAVMAKIIIWLMLALLLNSTFRSFFTISASRKRPDRPFITLSEILQSPVFEDEKIVAEFRIFEVVGRIDDRSLKFLHYAMNHFSALCIES